MFCLLKAAGFRSGFSEYCNVLEKKRLIFDRKDLVYNCIESDLGKITSNKHREISNHMGFEGLKNVFLLNRFYFIYSH